MNEDTKQKWLDAARDGHWTNECCQPPREDEGESAFTTLIARKLEHQMEDQERDKED